MTSNNKVSNFFKQYLPKHGKDGLGIPDAFVEHLNGSPKKAVLRNWMGEIWYVEIGYTDAEVLFLKGWHKFVNDNSV
ncbi:putative B3 domain-containing protein At5g66980 [Pistacia vera]|uniref:putative B3 domain-containing protein At5g66980 n=1 Tax=Pistacia vera TaxID=55513 RepID=UPI001263098C|nr:putative B3 domain-containing protein At5g66980 [Pistacia vera]